MSVVSSRSSSSVLRGQVVLLLGTMASDKTTELLCQGRRFAIAGKRVCLIKYDDGRTSKHFSDLPVSFSNCLDDDTDAAAAAAAVAGEQVLSRSGATGRATLAIRSLAPLLNGTLPHLREYDVFLLDEAHFFSPWELRALVLCCRRLLNKPLFMTALHSTFKLQPWATVSWILPLCTDIRYHTAVCSRVFNVTGTEEVCGDEATLPFRLDGGVQSTVDVGGDEKYQSRCMRCYDDGIREQQQQRNGAQPPCAMDVLLASARDEYAEYLSGTFCWEIPGVELSAPATTVPPTVPT